MANIPLTSAFLECMFLALLQRIAVEDPESIVCGTRETARVLVEAHIAQSVPVRVVFAQIHH